MHCPQVHQAIPSPSMPCLASTILSSCVRSCLTLIGPAARPCLALPCSTLPCTVLSDLSSPVWRCSALPCLTLPSPALSSHARPCLALLYLCPAPPGPAWHCPTVHTLVGAAWPGPVRHCPATPAHPYQYPILPGSVRPVRTCLALVRHCLALPSPVWPCPVLFGPARPCLVCKNDVNCHDLVDNALSEFKLYSSAQQSENTHKKTMVLASYYTREMNGDFNV